MMIIKEVSNNVDSTCLCNGACKSEVVPTWYKKFEYITGITHAEMFDKLNIYLHTIPVDNICSIDYSITNNYAIVEHLYKQ